MYSFRSSLIIDKINDSSIKIKNCDFIPENYCELSDIINDDISVLYFFLKKYYEYNENQNGVYLDNKIILKLIDKYYNPEITDSQDIIMLMITNDDIELLKYINQKVAFSSNLSDNIFTIIILNNSFKILNYYLQDKSNNFWKLFITNFKNISYCYIDYNNRFLNQILRENQLSINTDMSIQYMIDDVRYLYNDYSFYFIKNNIYIEYLFLLLDNLSPTMGKLIIEAIYISNDMDIFGKYLIYICKNFRVDLLKEMLKFKKYYFTNYFTHELFCALNDRFYQDKLDEYKNNSKEDIKYNRHQYVSSAIINITKILLPFVYDNCSPDIFNMLQNNFQNNLHHIVTLKNAVKLLKKLEPFNLNYANKDEYDIYVFQDLFRYGTYDTVNYVMKKYQGDIISILSTGSHQGILETISLVCNNKDSRLLKIYLDFLENVFTDTKEITKFICKNFRNIQSVNYFAQFLEDNRNFKIKIKILLDFLEKHDASNIQKNSFLTSIFCLTIEENNYYCAKYILSFDFSISEYYIFNSYYTMLTNKKNKKFKINEFNRQMCDKFIINENFYDAYYDMIESLTNTYCLCRIKKFLIYLWSRMNAEQLKYCHTNMIKKHTQLILNIHYENFVHKCHISKIFEKTQLCSICNPKLNVVLDDDKCQEIIHFYKKILGKQENDTIYTYNFLSLWQGCSNWIWSYYRIMYMNGIRHYYEEDLPTIIINKIKDTHKKIIQKHKSDSKFDKYLECINNIKNFQLSVQYIRKRYLRKYNKNLYIFKNNIQFINNEFKFNPIKNNLDISNKIGYEFKKLMSNKFVKNPVHLTPKHMVDPNVNTKYIYFTEKADGITKINLPIDIFPKIEYFDNHENFSFELEDIEYEYIESLNMCMVFNIYNTSKSLVENLMYLRYIHPYVPNYLSEFFTTLKLQKYDLEHINKFKKYEQECFEKYISDNKDTEGTLWWPKMIFTYKNDNVIEYLDNIHKITSQNLDIFPTDGWILYSQNPEDDILKVKPYNHLTIDLRYKNNMWSTYNKDYLNVINNNIDLKENGIYRCYYSEKLQQWEPRELRWEKKNPNNSEICKYITRCHREKWSIQDIITLYQKKSYYLKNTNIKSSFKYDITPIIKMFKDKNILDLGCGYKAKTFQKKLNSQLSNYVGLDSDINLMNIPNVYLFDICNSILNQRDTFGNLYSYLANENIRQKFEVILCLNTIHYAFKDFNSQTHFVNNLDYFSNHGSIFIIRYLNSNKIGNLFDNHGIIQNDGSFIRDNGNKTYTIYYDWVHDKPLVEAHITLELLKKTLSFNWSYQDNISKQLNIQGKNNKSDTSRWQQYFNSFDYAVFQRIYDRGDVSL